MNGIITDIQKFSLNDGSGIRTTVFVKGCNMRCRWCHNPETFDMEPQKAYYQNKCIHCGHCSDCPTGARTTVGRSVSAQAVFDELASDVPYYANSGGGVTISGGEPLLQADFCAALLRLCREAGLSTAVETNLSLPFEQMEKLLPFLDMVYYDIKLWDERAHKEATGRSNAVVLQNARLLADRGVPAVVHTPLIPGFTATPENVSAIARFAGTLGNVTLYELLNYNPLAEAKYRAIGMDYPLKGLKRLTRDELSGLQHAAEGFGVPVNCR